MIVSGTFWNGGPCEITGKVIHTNNIGVLIEYRPSLRVTIAWRYMQDDLFIPVEWSARIKADREKWGVRI